MMNARRSTGANRGAPLDDEHPCLLADLAQLDFENGHSPKSAYESA
jgi:hypothetical protein